MEKMKVAMSERKMIKDAREAGYIPTTGRVLCPKCKMVAEEALRDCHRMQAELLDRTIEQVPWIKPECAMVFVPKWAKVQTRPVRYACACGWRKSLTKKPFVKKTSVLCSHPSGCNSILTQWDKDNDKVWCTKHRKEGTNPLEDMPHPPKEEQIPVEKARVKCGCGAVLPVGRKMYCFSCRAEPITKEEASKESKPLVY